MKSRITSFVAPLVGLLSLVSAISLDLNSQDSVKSALSTIAYDMMTFYSGNKTGQTPGLLPGPCSSSTCYYWWEAGAMFGSLVNYWQYTGDDSYNPVVEQALAFQIGPDKNYNPPNQSKNMGVDDQAFWAFSALDAAEANFPEPGGDVPSWIALAQAVFNFQADLWDAATCGGGMRWQVYSFNAGYNLKNTISNGGNFQLAARLARYTGNQTYADWANKMWDWMAGTPLFQFQDGTLYIWDNTNSDNNCSDVAHFLWTYNYGTMLMGAAYMYNFTNGAEPWGTRVNQILEGAFKLFFPSEYGGNIMSEFQCEPSNNCNNDQSSFKAYLSRWMAVTTLMVPSTADQIMAKLQASAAGAAQQCTGGDNGRMCGRRWYSTWDSTTGVGQQMQALSVIGATQINSGIAPKSVDTGGTSESDPNAGTDTDASPVITHSPITTKDKAGAGVLTVAVIFVVIGGAIWIIV
ncbi:Mannan endo-1,6-alpha-mannosidase DCW1 [Exophiala dermatitidis]